MQNMFINATNLSNSLFGGDLKSLAIINYNYTPDEAVEELGLDLELVNQLIEDYVAQIVKSNMIFVEHLRVLKNSQITKKNMDYTDLRELAHKNLGVARNLRIYDAEKLLEAIMIESDLEYIFLCLDCLLACVTMLKPQEAFDTLRLIKIKDSF